ncbi:hypothetical protein KL86DYS2_12399 [uncultured Dysgonomonas sp.]|uniref:Lipoprotein n=1 Tax=uncultured Dysgonomonas sp. TaxID=206096 RepID=A0A212JV36_9BACT|nr:hypothetical protein [uncultured Dysgonomonas sp.]SBW03228.1 hypothetical protein KL86DYS2_12399 [uncultured Dysgonomonas sp.]
MMKNLFYFIFAFILVSCSQEDFFAEKGIMQEQTKKKVETLLKDGDSKVETEGTYAKEDESENMHLAISNALQGSYNKTKVYKSSTALVGILGRLNCGTSPKLHIYMDCEDDKNASSVIHPQPRPPYMNIRSFPYYLDSNGNVNLHFCVVPRSHFYIVKDQVYGVLQVTNELERFTLVHYIDNEDDKNKNSTTYNGQRVSNLGSNAFGSNTTLVWTILDDYDKTSRNPRMPDIGGYVLGKLKHNYDLYPYDSESERAGYLKSDDEDSNNKNSGNIIIRYPDNTIENVVNVKGFWTKDLIKVDKNTEFNFHKIGSLNEEV